MALNPARNVRAEHRANRLARLPGIGSTASLSWQGRGFKRDERIYGASLIDIAPTVLTLFGLPIGEDMDGRPLLEAFEVPPKVKTIPSWEKVPANPGCMWLASSSIASRLTS